MFASVSFPIPYSDSYTYRIPEVLQGKVISGSLVKAPFGNKIATGVVIDIFEQAPAGLIGLKEITGIDSIGLPIPSQIMELASLVSEKYLTSPGIVFKSILPPGSFRRSTKGNKWPADFGQVEVPVTPKANLQAGKVRYLFSKIDSIPSTAKLSGRQEELLRTLINSREGIQFSKLAEEGYSPASAKRLIELGLAELRFKDKELVDIGGYKQALEKEIISLNLWQQAALKEIDNALLKNEYSGFLLYGVISSGKTQVYIEAARNAIDKGKSVLVLVPEISLTPQIVARFKQNLNTKMAVLHSQLNRTERLLAYKGALNGRYRLIIGARSAMFSPLKDLGLIIVDEEQDNSYKQEDPAPRYNARDLAIERAKLERCTVVLGSATPSLETYYQAKQGELNLLTLPEKIPGASDARIEIVSTALKNQIIRRATQIFLKGYWPLTERLYEEILLRLKNNEQTIILLNRRGYSSAVVCFECGWLGKCDRCEVGFVYYKSKNVMLCHYCGKMQKGLTICPKCGSGKISLKGAGTEKLEESLKDAFPSAKIARLDSDAVLSKWGSRDILEKFGRRKIDILLGTQMVAKGHHFPDVTLVGAVNADIGLSLPDFRSSERLLQLLMQAAGRAGRARHRKGMSLMLVQTFANEDPVFSFLSKHDYIGFLESEIPIRKALQYPPFRKLIRIVVSAKSDKDSQGAASAIKDELSGWAADNNVVILGPTDAPIKRIKGEYRVQLLIKMVHEQRYEIINELIETISKRIRRVKIKIDVDPTSFL